MNNELLKVTEEEEFITISISKDLVNIDMIKALLSKIEDTKPQQPQQPYVGAN